MTFNSAKLTEVTTTPVAFQVSKNAKSVLVIANCAWILNTEKTTPSDIPWKEAQTAIDGTDPDNNDPKIEFPALYKRTGKSFLSSSRVEYNAPDRESPDPVCSD